MKETLQRFERRTGIRYDPPRALLALGTPLRPRDAVPTLFRFPSPDALQQLLQGQLQRLAPAERTSTWFASAIAKTGRPIAARSFGLAVVLQPLLFAVVRGDDGEYLGVNRPLRADEVAWVPPSAFSRRLPWDALEEPAALEKALGPKLADERERALDALGAYLEEVSLLDRAGAPPPAKPWSELPAKTRVRTLADAGVRSRWTRAR